jgi:hypothetical protein
VPGFTAIAAIETMEKIIKSHPQVARQMEKWYLNYIDKQKEAYTGHEPFTFFDRLFYEKQNRLYKLMDLPPEEIPVFFLHVRDDEFVVSTTQRFVKISAHDITCIPYANFNGHEGFKFPSRGHVPGHIAAFGFKQKNERPVYWDLPTGVAGHTFHGVTNRCELIGRRYEVTNTILY